MFALPVILAVSLAGCPLFTQEIKRDVQAVWSDDDSSILIAESSYRTSSPSEPYFNTTQASGWKTAFYQASASDLSGRTLLTELEDTSQPGGLLQYQAMYWFSGKGCIVVAAGDTAPCAIFVNESARKVQFNLPSNFRDYLDKAVKTAGAQDLAPLDTVPSPDGDLTAVLWHIAYDSGTNPMVPDLKFNTLLSFYLTHDGTLLATVRLSDSGGKIPNSGNWPLSATVPTLHPYPIKTDAPNYTRMAWSNDSQNQGIFVVQPGELPPHSLFIPFSEETTAPPSSPPVPMPVTQVPSWPVPTTSGPISDSGKAVVMTISGNSTELSIVQVSGWVRFEDVGRTDYSQANYTGWWDAGTCRRVSLFPQTSGRTRRCAQRAFS
jgi:hypothetical protein